MKLFLEKLQKTRDLTKLDPQKKKDIRLKLEKLSVPAPKKSFFFQPFQLVLAMLLLMVVIGASASYAAADSLPGDKLYPIKIHVNEAVVAALSFSPQAKAQFEITKAATRLEEADQLAVSNRLSEPAKQSVVGNFDKNTANIQNRIDSLESSGHEQEAMELNSKFESVLRVHEQVLSSLHDQAGPTAAEIKPIQDNVGTALESFKRNRAKFELKHKDSNSSPQVQAEAELKSAEQAVNEVKGIYANQSSKNADLEGLEAILSRAKDRNKSGNFQDSSALANQTIRGAQDLKNLAQLQQKLKINVRLRFGDDDQDNDQNSGTNGDRQDNILRGSNSDIN